jgi:predicted ribosomally synthesized peptide with SipW-like signal peptide
MRILKSLAMIGVVAALAVSATGAYFSDQKKIEGNTFSAGTLTLSEAHGTLKPWDVKNFAPGYKTDWEYVSLTNTGSLAGRLTATVVKTGGSDDLFNALYIEVRNNAPDGHLLYYGPLNAINLGPYDINAGQTRTGWQRISLPDSGDQNGLQGKSVTFDEVFNLTQP